MSLKAVKGERWGGGGGGRVGRGGGGSEDGSFLDYKRVARVTVGLLLLNA